MSYKPIIYVSFLILISSCFSEEGIYFYSSDKSQCLTVIDSNESKFIFNEKISSLKSGIEEKPYVEFDLTNVTESGHAIFICWQTKDVPLMVLCPETKILKNSFNPEKVRVQIELNKDDRGIPTAKPYHNDGCFEFDYMSRTIFPKGHATKEVF